jgi:hypothetical protein
MGDRKVLCRVLVWEADKKMPLGRSGRIPLNGF